MGGFCRPGGVCAWGDAWSDELRGAPSGLTWGAVRAAVQRLALEDSGPLQCSGLLRIASGQWMGSELGMGS